MKKLIIASMHENAGKTSLIVGLAGAIDQKTGYLKPLGDRLLYRKKRLWDHDSALVSSVFGLHEDPGAMSIGFDHSKLRYMYNEAGMRAKLQEALAQVGPEKELLLVEAGKDLSCGASVYLDPITLARLLEARLILVVSGAEDSVLDDLTFLARHTDLQREGLTDLIVNKVHNLEEFAYTYLPAITQLGFNVLGTVPYAAQLNQYAVGFLAERLFAKVLAGEAGLTNIIQDIFVGAVAVNAALRNPSVNKASILTITSGDRTDVILAALESGSAGLVLTNNIVPPSNIISQAAERNIPLLLVATDTYEVARQVYSLQPLLTKDDTGKIATLTELVKQHVNIKALLA